MLSLLSVSLLTFHPFLVKEYSIIIMRSDIVSSLCELEHDQSDAYEKYNRIERAIFKIRYSLSKNDREDITNAISSRLLDDFEDSRTISSIVGCLSQLIPESLVSIDKLKRLLTKIKTHSITNDHKNQLPLIKSKLDTGITKVEQIENLIQKLEMHRKQ